MPKDAQGREPGEPGYNRHSTAIAETKKGFHVKRVRTRDSRYTEGERSPHLGEIRYSKTFPTRQRAEREAAAWRGTGDWAAEVVQI